MKKINRYIFSDFNMSSTELAQVVGNNIDNIIRQKNLTLKELSHMTKIHYHQLSAYVRGVHLPTAKNLLVVSRTLDVPMDSFFVNNQGLQDTDLEKKVSNADDFEYKKFDTETLDRALVLAKKLNYKFHNYKESMLSNDNPFLHYCISKLQKEAISLGVLLSRISADEPAVDKLEKIENEALPNCRSIQFLLDMLKQNDVIALDMYDDYLSDVKLLIEMLNSF